jgi:Ca-activated chloride channel homolog
MPRSILRFLGVLAFAAFAAGEASAQTNVMFIFDASGSMKRSAGAESRIVAAKRAFSETLGAMPAGVRTGLIAYGHRRAKDCSDIEVVSPIGADEARTQARMVEGFEALGETPIADAINRAGQAMQAFRGQSNSIVLVTDGIEECRGDPCAAAANLKSLGIDVKVHVVGFALGAGESSKLQCVVEQTGGRYFDANDVNALRRTLAEVRTIVAQAAPPPAPAPVAPPAPAVRKSKVVFVDDFDGKDLSGENWQVINRNDDRFIVEKGTLMMVNPAESNFAARNSTNIFTLKEDLPDGDWDIVIDAKLQLQTGKDNFIVGLRADEKSFLNLRVYSDDIGQTCGRHLLGIERMSGGELTHTEKIFSGRSCGYGVFGDEDPAMLRKVLVDNGARITISKRDRKYSGTLEIKDWVDAKKNPRKVVTEELTSLRTPGKFSITVGKWDPKRGGDTIAFIDKVQVIAYE